MDGAASKSFGLQVAGLAGVPKPVLAMAKEKLKRLEQHESVIDEQKPAAQSQGQLPLEPVMQESEVELQLAQIDPDDLTPRQAHELLYKLKSLLN